MAELSSFLKVLEREEKNHEMQIRERYQLLNERLRETMQLSNPTAYKSILSNQTNHLAVSNWILKRETYKYTMLIPADLIQNPSAVIES